MRRADDLFAFETRSPSTPLVEATWSTRTGSERSFLSVAACHWEVVVTRQEHGATLTVRGPATRASPAPVPVDADIIGIQFSHGTFMPDLPPHRLVDTALTLPSEARTGFWLDGSAWELPGADDADVFVDRLVRAGLLVHDPVVAAALQDDLHGLSLSRRTVERRVRRATGLSRTTIGQIQRATLAVELLGHGVPAIDVVHRAGYADQPHLTRSLKRFVGQTPSEITAAD